MRKFIIDADSIMYAAAHAFAGTESNEWEIEGEEIDADVDTQVPDMLKEFWYRVSLLVDAYECEIIGEDDTEFEVEVVLTYKSCDPVLRRENFRYDLTKEASMHGMDIYKANRAGMPVPDGINDLYVSLVLAEDTPHTIVIPEAAEADDYVVMMSKEEGVHLCAIDKDVINASLSPVYNYHHKHMCWVYPTNMKDRRDWFFTQVLMGDASDGIKGAWKVGKVGAAKIVDKHLDDEALWAEILQTYKKKGQSEEEAIATARCVNMHQMQANGQIALWEPPFYYEKFEFNNGD